jgi:hypothetical protein
MGLYAYAIGRPSYPAPDAVVGIGGSPVEAAPLEGFSVWLSRLPAAPGPSLDRVRAHNAVVEAACAKETPLPLRFGQWFESADALARSLAERREVLDGGLHRVAGALEYGVRIVDPTFEEEPPERSTGKAYLESLARRARMGQSALSRGRDAAAALQSWLGPLAREARVSSAGGSTLAVVALLVARHDTRSYGERIKRFPPRRPELEFVFTGPWPPYGFVE